MGIYHRAVKDFNLFGGGLVKGISANYHVIFKVNDRQVSHVGIPVFAPGHGDSTATKCKRSYIGRKNREDNPQAPYCFHTCPPYLKILAREIFTASFFNNI
jgi:hypothetical protein